MAFLPPGMREGVLGLVGYINTPFVVNQEEYFGGLRDLPDIDEPEQEEARPA